MPKEISPESYHSEDIETGEPEEHEKKFDEEGPMMCSPEEYKWFLTQFEDEEPPKPYELRYDHFGEGLREIGRRGIYQLFGLGEIPPSVEDYKKWERRHHLTHEAEPVIGREACRRSIDHAIRGEVRWMVNNPRGGSPRILEVGMGTSYSIFGDKRDQDYNCPWLARQLQLLHGDKIDLIATDIETSDINQKPLLYEVMPRREIAPGGFNEGVPQWERDWTGRDYIYYKPFILSEIGGIELPSDYTELQEDQFGHFTFRPLPSQALKRLRDAWKYYQFSAHGAYYYTEKKGQLFNNDPSSGQVYLRPRLDPVFERYVFGLHIKGGVDIHNLGEHFEAGSFDLIYGRNLEPDKEWNIWGVLHYLKPTGKILISVGASGREGERVYFHDREDTSRHVVDVGYLYGHKYIILPRREESS